MAQELTKIEQEATEIEISTNTKTITAKPDTEPFESTVIGNGSLLSVTSTAGKNQSSDKDDPIAKAKRQCERIIDEVYSTENSMVDSVKQLIIFCDPWVATLPFDTAMQLASFMQPYESILTHPTPTRSQTGSIDQDAKRCIEDIIKRRTDLNEAFKKIAHYKDSFEHLVADLSEKGTIIVSNMEAIKGGIMAPVQRPARYPLMTEQMPDHLEKAGFSEESAFVRRQFIHFLKGSARLHDMGIPERKSNQFDTPDLSETPEIFITVITKQLSAEKAKLVLQEKALGRNDRSTKKEQLVYDISLLEKIIARLPHHTNLVDVQQDIKLAKSIPSLNPGNSFVMPEIIKSLNKCADQFRQIQNSGKQSITAQAKKEWGGVITPAEESMLDDYCQQIVKDVSVSENTKQIIIQATAALHSLTNNESFKDTNIEKTYKILESNCTNLKKLLDESSGSQQKMSEDSKSALRAIYDINLKLLNKVIKLLPKKHPNIRSLGDAKTSQNTGSLPEKKKEPEKSPIISDSSNSSKKLSASDKETKPEPKESKQKHSLSPEVEQQISDQITAPPKKITQPPLEEVIVLSDFEDDSDVTKNENKNSDEKDSRQETETDESSTPPHTASTAPAPVLVPATLTSTHRVISADGDDTGEHLQHQPSNTPNGEPTTAEIPRSTSFHRPPLSSPTSIGDDNLRDALEEVSLLLPTPGSLSDDHSQSSKNTEISPNSVLNFIRAQIIRYVGSVFVAGLFVALGFAIFASSVKFGLAVKGGFLMAGALGSPLFVFALAALAVTLISHLVIRALKSSVPDTPPSQAIASILEAQKIFKAWQNLKPENHTPELAARFYNALKEQLQKIKPLTEGPWNAAIVANSTSNDSHTNAIYAQRLENYFIFFSEIIKKLDNTNGNLESILSFNNNGISLEQALFKFHEVADIDLNYRPVNNSSQQTIQIGLDGHPIKFPPSFILLWSALSAAFLVGCVALSFYIFIAGTIPPVFLGISGMVWSLTLAAGFGVASWFSANRVLSHTSGGPYAKLAAILGAGMVIFATLALFLPFGTITPIMAAAAGGLAISFISSTVLAYYKSAKLSSAERIEKSEPLSDQSVQLNWLRILGLITSWVACAVPTFFIISGTLNPLFLMLAIPAGFACLALTDDTLNRFSNSPFATLAAVSLLALMTVALVWSLSGVGLTIIFLPVSLALIASCVASAFFWSQDKDKHKTARAGQEGERVLRMVQIALIVGFLFLAFVSIAMVLQLGQIGHLSGILELAYDLVGQALGYGGLKVGAQWLSAFFVGTFATSGFMAFTLLQRLLQRSVTNTAELEQHKNAITIGTMLFKLMFTVGLIVLLAMMPAIFPAGAITSILPAFIVVAAVMPLFSGNARLPYFHALNNFWNNTLLGGLGVTPLLNQQGSHLWFRYFFREVVMLTILGGVVAGAYFAAGASLLSLTVLVTGAIATEIVRLTATWRNAQDMTRAQYPHDETQKSTPGWDASEEPETLALGNISEDVTALLLSLSTKGSHNPESRMGDTLSSESTTSEQKETTFDPHDDNENKRLSSSNDGAAAPLPSKIQNQHGRFFGTTSGPDKQRSNGGHQQPPRSKTSDQDRHRVNLFQVPSGSEKNNNTPQADAKSNKSVIQVWAEKELEKSSTINMDIFHDLLRTETCLSSGVIDYAKYMGSLRFALQLIEKGKVHFTEESEARDILEKYPSTIPSDYSSEFTNLKSQICLRCLTVKVHTI